MIIVYVSFVYLFVFDAATAEKVTQQRFDFEQKVWKDLAPPDDCPFPCHCPSPAWVDCSSAELVDVPGNISNRALHLKLNENKLESLTSECFTECPQVRTLNLRNNLLSDKGLSHATFASFHQLHDLLLSNNRLQIVPRGLPDTLVTLHLEGNNIKKIDADTLVLNGQLRHLYLHNNQLTNEGMSRKWYRGLRHLEEVTLSNNRITVLPPIPSSAEIIYLQNNNIANIPEGSFRRKRNVRVLFLQNNRLSNDGIMRKSFAGLRRIEYLDLSSNNLTTIPRHLPTKLRRLHLEKNRISNLTRSSLDRLRNGLVSSGIEQGAFSRLHRLNTLHIFDNKLSEIPKLPRRIKNLVILRNQIRSMSLETFVPHHRLEQLDLRHNQLNNGNIARGALRRLGNLVKLDFTGNKLRAVPVLPRNISTLILSSNHISRIPPRSLERMPHLRNLALGSNKLVDKGIPLNVFRNNRELLVLDMSDNKLTYIPRFLPPNLEYIYLNRNKIDRIPTNSFLSALKLKGVFLQENLLLPDTVSKAAFAPLRHLRRVDITWTQRDVTKTSRHRRSLLVQKNGWDGDACALPVLKQPCKSGNIMVLTSWRTLPP